MSSNPSIGQRISEARAQKDYSVVETARLVGVTTRTIRRWESGKSTPRGYKLQHLSGILGIPLGWLLEGSTQFEPQDDSGRHLKILGNKIERISRLQQELTTLNNEVAVSVEELHKSEEDAVSL